ncbi:sensor histidine kinase [Nitrosomonas sp. Is37]|uniref:sensor histidine kinase n=1 Tax=Nitrosomonas sp. Is37 TaxID=3080535 RepID=UPI00294B2C55|nr:ATP-binding protein [Nitrosomonas sp. Is37]MDV6345309.1 histidine kinase [Nitrosomonas sp. Is37]
MAITYEHRKISIIGGLLLLGLTLTTGIAVYDVMHQQIESALGRGLDVALEGKTYLFEIQIEKGLADTRALAMRPFMIQPIQQLNIQPDNVNALHDLDRNVNSLTQIGFSAAIVYDVHGNVLSQVGHFSDKQTQSLPLTIQNNTYLLWDDQFILRTSEDVLDEDGNRIGSFTTESFLPHLTRRFSEIRSIGETGEFILCAPQAPGDSAQEMACLMSQIDGVKFKYLYHATKEELLPINNALGGKSGVMAVKDYRHMQVIAAYAPLDKIGLGMVLKLDEEELLKPVAEQLKFIILYLAGLIAAEILLLNWFVLKLINSRREAQEAKEKAELFSIELSHKELELRKRLKEITCLYEIRRGMGLDVSVDNVCQNIFEHLIPAMQFPKIATAVIELYDWRYISGQYNQGLIRPLRSKTKITDKIVGYHWHKDQNSFCTYLSEIIVNDEVCGQLRLFYSEDQPFPVIEEQKLINAIASDLAGWLERKRLEQALVFVAEEQAHTIGQELHDNLGQRIAAIGYQARALEKKISALGKESLAGVAASIAAQAQASVVQIKQLAQGLLPFELEANGLIAALQALASRIASTYKINCEFVCENETIINDNNLALNLYRITQEAANNAIRHGGARYLRIFLSFEEGMLCLSICDDGSGIVDVGTKHEVTQGMGIKIMQYRAKQLGAKLELLMRPEGGTEVRLEMQLI